MLQDNSSPTGINITRERFHPRSVGCIALLFALVAFSILTAWVLFKYSLPGSPLVRIGTIDDFQYGQEPQLFWKDDIHFYVVKEGDKLIALSPYSRRVGYRCKILWYPDRQQFVDPCWGTRMDIEGKYEFGPPWEMPELPVHIINGEVWVEVK